jgi:glycosyltransferase involved in cell wall biosynthesis
MDVRPLQARARDLGVGENVRWDLRFVPETEVPEIFESATVVVLPYRRADQSSVLMTALAFDKPVVATRVGGLAEVLRDGVHGLLVEPGDVEGLARALATLLTDAGLRRRMAEAIRTLAAGDLSWDAVAARTLEVYGEIRRRGPGRDTGREPGVGRETPD